MKWRLTQIQVPYLVSTTVPRLTASRGRGYKNHSLGSGSTGSVLFPTLLFCYDLSSKVTLLSFICLFVIFQSFFTGYLDHFWLEKPKKLATATSRCHAYVNFPESYWHDSYVIVFEETEGFPDPLYLHRWSPSFSLPRSLYALPTILVLFARHSGKNCEPYANTVFVFLLC